MTNCCCRNDLVAVGHPKMYYSVGCRRCPCSNYPNTVTTIYVHYMYDRIGPGFGAPSNGPSCCCRAPVAVAALSIPMDRWPPPIECYQTICQLMMTVHYLDCPSCWSTTNCDPNSDRWYCCCCCPSPSNGIYLMRAMVCKETMRIEDFINYGTQIKKLAARIALVKYYNLIILFKILQKSLFQFKKNNIFPVIRRIQFYTGGEGVLN